MIDPKTIDELTKRFVESIPPGIRQIQTDVESNVRSAMQSAFSRMDLVTREEFDVQQAVLARTRGRLEALERKLEELEAHQRGEPTTVKGGPVGEDGPEQGETPA